MEVNKMSTNDDIKEKEINKDEATDKTPKKDVKSKSGGKGKGQKIAIAVLALLLVAAGLYIFLPRESEDLTDPDVPRGAIRGTVVTPDNVDEIREQLRTPPEDAYFTTSMNTDWVFETWDTPSQNAFVENIDLNTRTVYFDLFLRETRELVYSSPFIPVGATLEGFALDTMVPEGVHSASVTYYLVDDDLNEVAQVSVAVTLTILG
jgi:hypothetical protein